MTDKNFVPLGQRIKGFFQNVGDFYDWGSLPAFLIFFVVVTLGMTLNYISMKPVIGVLPAALVSGLFEFGILAWEWTSNRKRNNQTQDETVKWAVGLSVALAVIMLVVNLFRTSIEQSIKAELVQGVSFNGWQIAAFIIIGVASLVHVVGYLRFVHNDTDREYARMNKRKQSDIVQRRREADDSIANAEADLDTIEKITKDLDNLRKRYINLPHAQLEGILENTRQQLLVKYNASPLVDHATAGLPDLDGSGEIGDEPEEAPARFTMSDEEEEDDLEYPGDGSQGEYLAVKDPATRKIKPAYPRPQKAPKPMDFYYLFVWRVPHSGSMEEDMENLTPFYGPVSAEQRETAREVLSQMHPDDDQYHYGVAFQEAEWLEEQYRRRGKALRVEPMPFALDGLKDRLGFADPRTRVLDAEPRAVKANNGQKPDPTNRRA